jgi:DNA-binding CsgD family transcriptional regulator
MRARIDPSSLFRPPSARLSRSQSGRLDLSRRPFGRQPKASAVAGGFLRIQPGYSSAADPDGDTASEQGSPGAERHSPPPETSTRLFSAYDRVGPGGFEFGTDRTQSRERELLDSLLDQLQAERAAVVISGMAGIGKSALLEYTRRRAHAIGIRPLVAIGVESEAEYAFAGLHQLLRPILTLTEQLPDTQRRALEAAFGLSDEVEPDPFHVALAAHQLVSQAAGLSPTILLVDDAHWLDRSTLDVVSFIARRLEGERIGLVAAVRDGFSAPLEEAHLQTLQLDRLSLSAAAKLLDRDAPDLHPVARARVLAEAAGNPLALVELPRVLQASDEQGSLILATPTLTARLERAFAERLDDLPEETRLMLLVAALDGRASIEEVRSSASRLNQGQVALSALDAALRAELVDVIGNELRFRHPLIRSALRQTASPAEIVAAYEVLAETVNDPERRLWHRAMSATGPDEEIAAELDDHATAARRRGAVTVAAAALERAAALSADLQRKGDRLVRGAEAAYELGLVDVARRLIHEAEPLELGSLESARLFWLQQMISGDVWVETGAAKTFVTLAERMRDSGDADMALRSLVPIAHRCWWTPVRPSTRQYLVDAAEGIGTPGDDPRLLGVIALAHPEVVGPSVLERVSRIRLHQLGDPAAALDLGIAAEKTGDFVLAAPFLARAVERLREQGRLGLLAQALVHFAWVSVHTGDWEAAVAAGTEGATLAEDSRQPQYGLTGQLMAALAGALRGNEPDLEAMIAGPERTLLAMRGGPLLAPAHLARGAAALGEGRYEDAFHHFWPVFDETSSAFQRFIRWSAVLDLVETGVRSGHGEQLGEVLAALEPIAARTEPPFLRAGVSCARPLLAADDEAEALFDAALDQDLNGLPFLRARTLFSYGSWLRKQRRRTDSRVPLRDAIELFDALGATKWNERARQELRATGESIGHRSPAARDRLTAQELQIAQLAADGLSNREIGERLVLSHRTIGSHLYRIFPKLEITSRTQLRGVLPATTDDARPVD